MDCWMVGLTYGRTAGWIRKWVRCIHGWMDGFMGFIHHANAGRSDGEGRLQNTLIW